MSDHADLRLALRKRWLKLLVPSAIGIAVLEVLRVAGWFNGWHPPGENTIQTGLFVFGAATGVALPILYRVAFASAHRRRESLPLGMFYRYMNNTLVLSLLAPYFCLLSLVLGLAGVLTLGVFLFSLYAAYTQFPSRRRIEADLRIFRVSV